MLGENRTRPAITYMNELLGRKTPHAALNGYVWKAEL